MADGSLWDQRARKMKRHEIRIRGQEARAQAQQISGCVCRTRQHTNAGLRKRVSYRLVR
jgi:hypothetical protein